MDERPEGEKRGEMRGKNKRGKKVTGVAKESDDKKWKIMDE